MIPGTLLELLGGDLTELGWSMSPLPQAENKALESNRSGFRSDLAIS